MVFGLATELDQTQGAMSIECRRGQHFEEVGLADVVGASAGDQDSAWAEHFEGTEVEFLVSADGRIQVPLRFGEGGRVKNDGVVKTVGGRVVLKEIEGVRF